jgi:hypothetical protein
LAYAWVLTQDPAAYAMLRARPSSSWLWACWVVSDWSS